MDRWFSAGRCEDEFVALQRMRLPSVRKFDQQAAACNTTYAQRCAGPSHATYAVRLQRAAQRERAAFLQSYNARLFNGMLMGAVGGIVVFRFLVRVSLLELASWLLFVFLEVSPKLYLGQGETIYESKWWTSMARVWETVVYNAVVDLDKVEPALLTVGVAVTVYVRLQRWFACCCGRGSADARRRRKQAAAGNKDLDV